MLGHMYDEILIAENRRYFENGNHTTVLAFDQQNIVGCASLAYMWIMPTFEHPTGLRAHLMNVYTKSEYRRKGMPML